MPLLAQRPRARFHPLTVSQVRPLTDAAIEVTLAVPDELAEDYNYVSGQYVALRTELEGKEVRRSYSICAAPTSGEIKIAIKRDLGGLFSNWANDNLKPGDVLDVMSPTGAFVSQHAVTSLNDPQAIGEESVGLSRYMAFAAGSGITPILSITRAVLASNPQAYMNLVYSNRAAMDVMFVEDIADLKDRYPSRLAVHHLLSREQRLSPTHTGRLDAEKLRSMLGTVFRPEVVDEWFLCGPFELVQLLRDELSAAGVSADKVRYELFTTGKPTAAPEGNIGRPVVADAAGGNIEITFNLDGLEGQVLSPKSARESILNAALRVRQDVPFACAGGVCGTCRAKVISGEVAMDENYALEPDEVAAGYVLTCQSHPKGDAVHVDFDS
ncbi:1,2-phenylacetyl-CoA epoxidase subunit PaaE [Gephyromycinifex aptenodytis]|uniref:1,2-phenylacetyl-CoA epoxidase subunit PaaE n=1 Tax=Gephyromycinifex aptenodytis TaxID=2716227 RepID=UPI00144516B9|nr:1,2-phenylacetyl-CoA epoxidase subunit PaaE [Gephyromycinifex aptenodytis]